MIVQLCGVQKATHYLSLPRRMVATPPLSSLLDSDQISELVEVSCSTWSKKEEYNNKNFSGAVTALAISPNGRYIASSTQSTVFIWSTSTRGIVAQ